MSLKQLRTLFEENLAKAQNGDALAQCFVANCYNCGYGVTQSFDKAIDWYTKSANSGNAEALCHLGEYYQYGVYVDRNTKQAFDYFSKSAKLGYAKAEEMVGCFYYYGWVIKTDNKQAFEYINRSAQKGCADGQNRLGDFYRDGIGTKKNLTVASLWYSKAVENGSDWAFSSWADIAPQSAFDFVFRLAQNGNAHCQYQLGTSYYFGEIGSDKPTNLGGKITKDMAKCNLWLTKSAEQNEYRAQYDLARRGNEDEYLQWTCMLLANPNCPKTMRDNAIVKVKEILAKRFSSRVYITDTVAMQSAYKLALCGILDAQKRIFSAYLSKEFVPTDYDEWFVLCKMLAENILAPNHMRNSAQEYVDAHSVIKVKRN